jgi:WD40 repeat protein
MRILAGHRGPIRAVAYAPGKSATLASAGEDGSVRLWNTAAGEASMTLPLRGRRRAALALGFTPAGDGLIVGRRDGGLERWDVAAQAEEDVLRPFLGPVVALVVAPDGTVLAAPRNQRLPMVRGLLCWRPGAQESLECLGWSGGILSLTLAPDGRAAAFGDACRTVEVWQRKPWVRRCPLRFANQVHAVAFSPTDSGRTLAAAAGRVVECWDLDERRRTAVCKGHRDGVHALAFTPDGRSLLSGSADRTVRLWDAASGKERAAWNWGVGRVHTVALSPDGMTAAAGGEKSELVVWDLDFLS